MTERMEPTMRLRWFTPCLRDNFGGRLLGTPRLQQLWRITTIKPDGEGWYTADHREEWRDVPVVDDDAPG